MQVPVLRRCCGTCKAGSKVAFALETVNVITKRQASSLETSSLNFALTKRAKGLILIMSYRFVFQTYCNDAGSARLTKQTMKFLTVIDLHMR
jgi:hypothetical protein